MAQLETDPFLWYLFKGNNKAACQHIHHNPSSSNIPSSDSSLNISYIIPSTSQFIPHALLSLWQPSSFQRSGKLACCQMPNDFCSYTSYHISMPLCWLLVLLFYNQIQICPHISTLLVVLMVIWCMRSRTHNNSFPAQISKLQNPNTGLSLRLKIHMLVITFCEEN